MFNAANDEEPLEKIRETQRIQQYYHRKQQKDEDNDVRRSLPGLPITIADVYEVIDKLMTRAPITVLELNALQIALLEYQCCIDRIMKTPGSLRRLVKELSGNDIKKQIAACRCLSNIAVSDGTTACFITRVAGAYMITGLDSLSENFAATCAYAIGNLMASGPACCCALLAVGACKLCDVSARRDVISGAVYALSHLVLHMKDHLLFDHLHKMIQFVSRIEIDRESAKLLFFLSCHRDFTHDLLPASYLEDIIEKVPTDIKTYLAKEKPTKKDKRVKDELTYLLRVLSNMNSNKLYKDLMIYFLENNLAESFKALLEEDDETVMWFLGNIMRECGEEDFLKKLLDWRDS